MITAVAMCIDAPVLDILLEINGKRHLCKGLIPTRFFLSTPKSLALRKCDFFFFNPRRELTVAFFFFIRISRLIE